MRLNLKTYQRILKNSIKEGKRVYHFNLFSNHKEDVKKSWSIIIDTLAKTSSQNINCEFEVDNRTFTDPAESANKFNKYFVAIGQSLSHNTQSDKSYNEYLSNWPNCHLTFISINENLVSNIIRRLENKSSYGHDNNSNSLIKKKTQIYLIKPLTFIITQCLRADVFPHQLKLSKVRPLFKCRDSKSFNTYYDFTLYF